MLLSSVQYHKIKFGRFFPVHMIMVLSVMIISIFSLSCTDDRDAVVIRAWETAPSPTGNLNEIADSAIWEPADLPFLAKVEGSPRNKKESYRYVWLRASFTVSGDPAEFQGIRSGRISLADTFILNGMVLGGRPPDNVGYFQLDRHYELRPGDLRSGDNQIYIRIGAPAGIRPAIYGNIELVKSGAYNASLLMSNLFYRQIPFGFGIFYTGIVLILLVFFAFSPREPLYVYAALALIYLAALIFVSQMPASIVSSDVCRILQWLSIPIYSILLALLIQAVYRIYFWEQNRIVFPLMVMVGAGVLVFGSDSAFYSYGLTLISITAIIMMVYFMYFIKSINRVSPERLRLISASGVSISIFMIIVTEVLSEIFLWPVSDIVIVYISPVFVVIFSVLFSREQMSRFVEMERLYGRLRELTDREMTITESAEEKLKHILSFIHENYQWDISREGLAGAVGLNVNYMGALFRSYTGKKINEYINDIRIDEASKRLAGGDEKIIDIALSVGFESLVTFNRVFKAKTGMTPTEYRKKTTDE